MTTLELVRRADFTEKAELLQIYSDSYCTVIDGNYLYLIENTQINPQKIIAKIDVKENCKIFNRDKANVFIDWSNMHFGNKDNIEDLPEEKIEQYIVEFLVEDINELITFSQKDFDYIESLVRRFDIDTQDKIHKAFKILDINDSLAFTEAYSFSQIEHLVEKQYYYICLNLSKMKYAVSSSNFKKYYSNGACGDWSKLIKKEDFIVIFFNKSDVCSYLNKETEELLRKDLKQNSTATIITRLLKIEDKLTKSLNEMVSTLAANHGIIKIDTINYPDVKDTLEPLEVLIDKYQHSTTRSDKLELFSLLKEKYSHIYSEFSKAQESLKALYNSYKSINKEAVNG